MLPPRNEIDDHLEHHPREQSVLREMKNFNNLDIDQANINFDYVRRVFEDDQPSTTSEEKSRERSFCKDLVSPPCFDFMHPPVSHESI